MKAQRVEKVLTLNQPLCGSRGERSESEPPAALRGWTKMDGEQKETLSCSEGRTGKGTACSPLTSTGTRRNRRWVRKAGARRGEAVTKGRARTPGKPSPQPRRLRCPPRAPQDPRTFRAEAAAQPEGTTDRPALPGPARPSAPLGSVRRAGPRLCPRDWVRHRGERLAGRVGRLPLQPRCLQRRDRPQRPACGAHCAQLRNHRRT